MTANPSPPAISSVTDPGAAQNFPSGSPGLAYNPTHITGKGSAMKLNNRVVLSAVVLVSLGAVALAQQKVPGEMWRHTMSMEASGFSMPSRTTEMCAPVGKPEEAMIRQQGPSECSTSNMQHNGGKTSFDFACTGKSPMQGHFEGEQSGNTMKGNMNATAEGMTMKMKFEATKLGKACEAVDYSNYKPPVVAAVAIPDTCQQIADKMDTSQLASAGSALLGQYPSPDGKGVTSCKQHAAFKKFCSAVQTPAGFADLDSQQWTFRDQPVPAGENEQARMMRAPLSESLKACGLGTDANSVNALQKKMVDAAKKNGSYGFVLYYAAGTEYAAVKDTAKKECSGRSFTNASNPQYSRLCANYGAALARDDRAGVMEAAGCGQEREDAARGICVGAKNAGSGSVANMGTSPASSTGAAGTAATGTASTATAAPSAEEAAQEEAAKKGNSTLDKGKKALKGLFGR